MAVPKYLRYCSVLNRAGKGLKSLPDDLTPSTRKAYVNLRTGMLCGDFAAHRFHEENI